MSSRFKIAQVAAAHGIRGEVKLRCFLEDPSALKRYLPLSDKSGRGYQLIITGTQKDLLIVKIDGITDRNAAELLRGIELYADSVNLPPRNDGEYYVNQLIGLRAQREDGTAYGTITAIDNFGAGDILDIQKPDGTTEMLPFNDIFVGEVKPEDGYIVVFPPDYIEAD